MQRRWRAIAVGVCGAVAVCAVVLGAVSLLHVGRWRFDKIGARWQLICRGGEVSVDNKPQRTFEVIETTDKDAHNRALWEAEHNRVRWDMEEAPPGPEYDAARLRMDAWENVHGNGWPKLHAVPTTALIEHRLHMVWVGLLAIIAAIALKWFDRDRAASSKLASRSALTIRLAAVAACVALAGIWIQSYRSPISTCIYAPRSTYAVAVVKGKIALGCPQQTDPIKLAAAEAIADRVHNNDLQWLVNPSMGRPNATISKIGITTEVRSDSPLEELAASSDEAETAQVMVDALNDPDRFFAAHAFLAELRNQQSFRRDEKQSYARGMRIGRMTYANLRYADMQILLTPEQRAFKKTTEIPTPAIVSGQLPAIEKKWHRAFDQWAQPHSLGWTTPLVLVPLSWIYSIWRRRPYGPNQCAACGYDLTGNVSGICPECGATVRQDAAPGATV